jgi:hypothetical protein
MTRPFRFDPPDVPVSNELVWLLRRAFGPCDVRLDPLDPPARRASGELAERLDVAARIASRTGGEALEREAGVDVAAALQQAEASAATVALVVRRVSAEVAAVAAALSVPALVLKGAWLELSGVAAAGSRSMGDVDVLVPEAAAEALRDALVERGAAVVDAPVSEHQLQWLRHPSGLGIEVHTAIPGVRLDGSSPATLEQVASAGACRRLEELPGETLVPGSRLGLAHLLVHGIAQHGLKPDSYPSTRVLGDLQDLLPERREWERLVPQVMPWIEHDVAGAEVGACRDLILDLALGNDPGDLTADDSLSGRYLRHVIAAATDQGYGQAMRFRSLATPVASGGRSRRLVRDAFRTVWLTDTQIDQLYGSPSSALGYWGRRLWRPFDLVARAWSYGAAWMSHRFRR